MRLTPTFRITSVLSIGVFSLFVASYILQSLGEDKKEPGLWRRLFPPKDLFDLVVRKEVDIGTTGIVSTVMFRLKYDGPYVAGILLDKFSNDATLQKRDFKLQMRIDVYADKRLWFTRITTNDFTPFLGLRGNGLLLTEFQTPTEVPLDKSVTGEITILVADESLNKQYGPVFFYIQKMSEK